MISREETLDTPFLVRFGLSVFSFICCDSRALFVRSGWLCADMAQIQQEIPHTTECS
jgi:hypothetical protein